DEGADTRPRKLIREQKALLPRVITFLANRGEELDTVQQFLPGWPYLAHTPVQMLDQTGHDLPQTRVGRCGNAFDNRFHQGLFVIVTHVLLLMNGVACAITCGGRMKRSRRSETDAPIAVSPSPWRSHRASPRRVRC